MEKDLTPAESLKLIETMIGEAKRSFHRNSFYFLLWGFLLIAAMIFNLVMARMGSAIGGYGWLVMGIAGGLVSYLYGSRESKRQRVSTAMDRVIVWLWAGFVITMLTTMIGAGAAGYTTPVGSIIVLTGLPTFVSGQLMRFRPLIFGGMLFWVLGAVSYFVTDDMVMATLYVLAMLFGYIVPGYLLKRQEDAVRAA
jgi:hypothetical protein